MDERIIAEGVVDGRPCRVERFHGAVTGDEPARSRFEAVYGAALSTDRPSPTEAHLAASGVFDELLCVTHESVSTDDELRARADRMNTTSERAVTVAALRAEEERALARARHAPPSDWSEIEEAMRDPRPGAGPHFSFVSMLPPYETRRCPLCLAPMRWIWFTSSRASWSEMGGRAGWLPVCERCRRWYALEVCVMS